MTPPNHDAQTHRDAWDRDAPLEQLTSHDIWWLRRDFLERMWPDVRGLRVVEVGSGPAHDSITFAERGAQVTAVDHSESGLRLASDVYARLRLPLQTVRADAQALPFKDGQFDIAFNAGVLEHFTDEQLERVVDEMMRVVKPGGLFVAFCPNRFNLFYQTHLRSVQDHHYDYERAFSACEMRRRLVARGLQDVRTSGVHVHPAPNYLLPHWLPKHHRLEPLSRACFGWFERMNSMHWLKALVGQDFVVWGNTPREVTKRVPIRDLSGGPAVRYTLYRPSLRNAA